MAALSLTEKLAALRSKAAQGTAPATEAPKEEAPPANDNGTDVKSKLAALRNRMGAAPQEDKPKAPATRAALDKAQEAPAPENKAPADVKTKLAALKNKTEAPSSATETAEPAYKAPKDGGARIGMLFINCAPSKGVQAATLEDIAAPVLQQIVEATGLSWAVHDFGKGKGYVVDGLNALPTYPEALVVDSRTPLGGAALEALVSRADIVVRGVA